MISDIGKHANNCVDDDMLARRRRTCPFHISTENDLSSRPFSGDHMRLRWEGPNVLRLEGPFGILWFD